MKYILTIAGSDSCGGAGIQADIKTITALGAHALTAITAVTAQNSLSVTDIYELPGEFISRQVETVLEDIVPDAVKIGMLPSVHAIEVVAKLIERYGLKNVVTDTVMKASTGGALMDASAVTLLKEALFPLVKLVTPNLHEAGVLIGHEVNNIDDMERAAEELQKLGPDVVIKGGHLEGDCTDLFYDGRKTCHFYGPRIAGENTHGTGCVFSSSLAAFLAFGEEMVDAVRLAHDFTRHAIERGYPCGMGRGAVYPST
jgi:hydroxymethylpyrimidine/phosphomethylpyrimidine kinase